MLFEKVAGHKDRTRALREKGSYPCAITYPTNYIFEGVLAADMKTYACSQDLMPSLFDNFLELWDDVFRSFDSIWSQMPQGQYGDLSLFRSAGCSRSYNGLDLHFMPYGPAQVLFPPLR